MDFSSGILSRDLRRMAKEGSNRQFERVTTDPAVLAEIEFFEKHGMWREQATEFQKMRRREDYEERAIDGLRGDPPENICNTDGCSPKRARFARYLEWLHQETKELEALQARGAELEAMIEAPAATEEKIKELVRRTASALMGRTAFASNESPSALDVQLAAERHQAEAARVALAELHGLIERAQLRVDHLRGREAEFLKPALIEIADELGLGKLYLQKIIELRVVMHLLFGLTSVAGGWDSGFERFTVRLPKTGLPSLAKTGSAEYAIGASGGDEWERLALSLRFNPRQNARHSISLPK